MRSRRHLVALALAAAAALTAHGLVTLRFFDGIFGEAERRTVDYRVQSTRTPQRDSVPVSLVMFDSMAVREWPYLMPFPRAVLAELVRTASASGAAVIGLDVFLDRRYPELSERDGGDALLRDAIRDAGNVVLVAPTVQTGRTRRLVPPDPYFADVAAAVAAADVATPYETIRDVSLVTWTESGPVPGFALALHALMRGMDPDSLVRAAAAAGRLEIEGLPARHARIAGSGATNLPLLYAGPPSSPERDEGAFRAYSAFGVRTLGSLTGFEPNPTLQSWMHGDAVLLGSGFHDSERFRSPFYDYTYADGELAGWTYGVEIHATALQNLLQGRYLRPLPRWAALLLLFAVAAAATGATFAGGAKWGAGAALAAFAVAGVAAQVVFAREQVVLPVIGAALAAVLAYTAAVAWVSVLEGREKRRIRGAFSMYVPPGVVDELVANPSRLELGGEKRDITILFSDIAGFTSLAELLPPERLVALLNEYLDEMSDIVFDERGTLDKYIGDAIMAFWGAPTPVREHALHACRAAVRMQRRLHELNTGWRERGDGRSDLRIRIGINTGAPVVGNIGGRRRFDYTALGDAVNLAARLEPACRTYGVSVMIAESTRSAAGAGIIVRDLDRLAVYGREEPVAVYELIGMADEPPDATMDELLHHYDNGLAAYRRRDFELAAGYFDAALELRPGDGPARLYRERSEQYTVTPPPADWDFVERRQVK